MLRLGLHGVDPDKAKELAQCTTRLPELCLTAVIDPVERRRQQTSSIVQASLVADSWSQLTGEQRDSIDAVYFDGPLYDRRTEVDRVIADRKHVLISAPGEFDVHEIERLYAKAREQRVTLGIRNLLPHRPSYVAVKESLESGKLGSPSLLRLNDWRAALKCSTDPTANIDESHSMRDAWSQFWQGVAENLEVALWIFGIEPNEIFATSRPSPSDGRDVALSDRCYVQVHLGFPNGGMALIGVANTLPPGDEYRSLTLIGSSGAAYADDHHQTQLLYRGGLPTAARTSESCVAETSLLRDFLSEVRNETTDSVATPIGRFPDGMTVARIVARVRDSIREQRPIG
ncbi:MAG: hypothetical protein RIS70_3517 [Planctomycetota bacterium]|jgi:predicted dehydrogenase